MKHYIFYNCMFVNSYHMSIIILTLLLILTYCISIASDHYSDEIKKVDSLIELNQFDSASVYLNEIGKHIKSEKNPIVQLKYFDRCAILQKHWRNYENTLAYYDSISKLLPFIKPETGSDSMLVARGYFCFATVLAERNKYS